MNLFDIIQPVFAIFFPFFVMALAFLSWRAIRSFWSREYDLSQKYKLTKGPLTFNDPIRPHSRSFYTYLQLAFMTTPNRQKRLVNVLSDRLKEALEDHPHFSTRNTSKELEMLINDPEHWLQIQNEKISYSRFSRKKENTDILHNQIIKLLEEVKEIYGLNVLQSSE